MIKIEVYDNAVEISGHDEPIICYQVSISMFHLANNVGYYGQRLHYENDIVKGYSKLVFNITEDTEILRDGFVKSMRLWFTDFYPNKIQIKHNIGETLC